MSQQHHETFLEFNGFFAHPEESIVSVIGKGEGQNGKQGPPVGAYRSISEAFSN